MGIVGKVNNFQKEEEKRLQKEFEEKRDSFLKEYQGLVDKYQVAIAPFIDISQNGILPKLVVVKLKKEVENNKA